MKKKIRDLTKKEKQSLCEKLNHECYKCPLSLDWTMQCISFLRMKDIKDFEAKLDTEIEVEEDDSNYKY